MNLRRIVLARSFLATLYSATLSAGSAATYTTNAISDAFVATGPTGNLSDNNYGGGGALAVAAGDLPNGEFQTVIKFDLSGVRNGLDAQYGAGQWSIQSVSLQLNSSPHNNAIYNNVAAGQFGISLMQNNSWLEGTGNASNPTSNGISYNTLLNTFINNSVDQTLGTFNFNGGTSGAASYTLGLAPGLVADVYSGDDASLRLFASDNNVSYLFSSRSASPASIQPELIITAVPEPEGLALVGLTIAMLAWSRRATQRPQFPWWR